MTGNNDAVGRLGRNNRLSLIGSLVSAALGFVVVFVVTNGLGKEGAGVVFVAAGVFNIAMQSAVLGTDAGLVRFIAQARTSDNEGAIRPLIKSAIVPVIVFGVALGVLVAVLAEPIGGLFSGDGDLDADVPTAIRVVAIIFPIGAIAMALLAVTRGFGQLRTTALADQIARPVAQLIAVAAVVLVGAGPVWATAAWVGPVIVSAIASALWLRNAPAVSSSETDSAEQITREFWSFSRPQAGTGMLRVVVRWLGTLVVGALLSLGAAAIFTAATRLLKLGNFVNQATFQAAAPQIAEDLGTGEIEQASSVYRSASTWLVLATWPLYLGAIFYAPEILRLFGEDFVDGAPALRILSAAMLVASASGPIEAVLVMSGRTTQNLINNIIALGVNIGLLFLLVPPFGLEGAAVAWAVSVLCTNLLPMAQVVRRLGMHPFGPTHLMTMAAISVGFAVTAAITRVLDLPSILTLIVGLGLAAVPLVAFAFWRREALALDPAAAVPVSPKASTRPGANMTSTSTNPAPPATGDRATVLYIGGLGRSGSTLLNDLMAQHESVVSVGEVNRLLKRGLLANQMCGCGKDFADCELWIDVGERLGGWDNLDVQQLLKDKEAIDRNRHSLKLLFPKIYPGASQPLSGFGEFHGRMLVAARDSANVPLVIDSTKQISTGLLLRQLDSIDLRMIHLVRDVRGVAYSWTKSRKKADEGDDRMMNQYPPGETARRWLTWNGLFAAFANIGVPVLRVRYEDLIANPKNVVEDVLRFGGVEPTKIDFVDGNTITLEPTHSIAGNPSRFKTGEMELRPDEAWRTDLDEKARKQVTRIAYPLLKKYGYL